MNQSSERTKQSESTPDHAAHAAPEKSYRRFDKWQRMEHAVLLVSFTVLAITGIPQKYSAQPWAIWMIGAMGGIEMTRLIHHWAAVILLIGAIYHFIALSYKVFVKRSELSMLPGWQDVKDGLQTLAYNVGLSKMLPKMGRFTFGEKVEYWAVIWGTVIMAITGFMLWNPIATARFLPGQFIPAAKAAHGGEAILAVLSILTWHFYNVHVKYFNKSMFTGNMERHAMEEEHPLELAAIEQGALRPEPDPVTWRQRMRLFVPIAAMIWLLLAVGLFLFVTYEETAIATIPRQDVEIFTPVTPTPAP
jgi:cytochrome b subunit of formate dehydrogenase